MAKFCADCKRVGKFNINEPPCSECYNVRDDFGRKLKPNFQKKGKETKGKKHDK